MNVFHFSKASPDFSLYDISPCFEDNQQMHLMVRMGWHPDMDIENTRKLFNDEIRNAVTMWGKVTYIRVVNIEVTCTEGLVIIANITLSLTLTSLTPPCSCCGQCWTIPGTLTWSWETSLTPSDP